uniref:Secreted protein n=1 Tax=Fundulus heteroclitus TaxID=8078 RepID=A0A3Q2PYM1_FUNHE
MERSFTVAVWMFLLFGFLQAMPGCEQSVDISKIPKSDLRFNRLKAVPCVSKNDLIQIFFFRTSWRRCMHDENVCQHIFLVSGRKCDICGSIEHAGKRLHSYFVLSVYTVW